jgi:hypothetical protein
MVLRFGKKSVSMRSGIFVGGILALALGLPTAFAAGTDLQTHTYSTTDACDRPVDLRRGGSVEGLPSGEQGNTYACGFFTAATLLDSYQIQRDGGFKPARLPIDPIALGIDLAIERGRPNGLPIQLTSDPLSDVAGRRGSYLCDIFRYAREHGVCDAGDPRVFDREWMRKRSDVALVLYRELSAYARLDESEQRDRISEFARKIHTEIARDGTRAPAETAVAELLRASPDEPYRVIRMLLYPKCAENRQRVFQDLPQCHDRYFAGVDAVGISAGVPSTRIRKVERAIHAGLDSPKPLPVPILHCYRVFREGRAFRGSSILSDQCILHYVNVIGRRQKSGACQFLVRNSYDPRDEDAVSKDWERDGEDFWIDSAAFAWSVYGVHSFED